MPWNLLILPLVAGYYILTRSYLFKFTQQRLDTQRLVFESVLLAVAAVAVTYSIRLFYEGVVSSSVQDAVYECIPIKTPYSGTSICTLLLAIGVTELTNLFLNKEKWIRKSIQKVGNEFELMLKSSITDGHLLQFTLDSGKVYIAWVKELPIPSVSNCVRIIPAISGYRDDSLNLVFTTHYLSVYSEYVKEGKVKSLEELNVDIVLNTKNIVSVGFFESAMYDAFNKPSSA